MRSARRTLIVAAMLAWTSMAACSDSTTALGDSNTTDGVDTRRFGTNDQTPQLIECPSTTTQTTERTITLLGGTISLGGTQVLIPAGALLAPVKIVLTVPASKYMEIDVSVAGADHFLFEKPIVVAIDYSRCSEAATRGFLSAWHIDTDSKALLEKMLGVDDKLNRRVIFTTGHLAGYARAN
jgi:hypothetical protein